ncbi:DUF4326 domain-containing protein [Mycobacterium sp. PSTR-4-N]|uniref:DUF4326 domain-containing protein n=1 Tax=Mycobacterium sp. PSTR-4-N TaxID=2917745 RepID=UPI001F152834|nr:DUF4326 domain-containing protein [Mycobacterium sp. PSTR-4-N]
MPEPNHPRWAGPRHYQVRTADGRIWEPINTIPVRPILGRAEAQADNYRRAAQHAVDLFELHIGPMGAYEYDDQRWAELDALSGRDFACWCPLDQPCHADVLLELANGKAPA